MNRAEFNERYELLKEVGGGGGSFHALSAGGAVVMVHFLGLQDEPETEAVLDKVSRLEPAESRRVLEVVDVEGRAVVITKFITDFSSLPDWLESRVAAGPPGPASSAPTPPPAARPATDAPPGPPPPPPPAKAPGEFTRMFGPGGSGGTKKTDDLEDWEKADTKKHRPAPAPEPPPPPASGPGEFTRMFTSGPAPEPPRRVDPPPPPPPPEPPGRDTWTDPPRAPLPPELPGSTPDWWGPLGKDEPPPPKEPGAFTKLFRNPQGPSEPPPPPPTRGPEPPAEKPLAFDSDSYQERLRGPERSQGPQGPPPPRPSTRAPTPSGPGAYTRVIQGPSTPSAPPPSAPKPPPPAPAPEPEPKRAAPRGLVLLIATVGVVFTALLVVVLFALLGGRSASPEAPPEGEVPATEVPAAEPGEPGAGAL